MRTALPTGQLRNVLFPADPVHHTAEILHALQTMFPGGGHPPVRAAREVRLGPADADPVRARVIYQWGVSTG